MTNQEATRERLKRLGAEARKMNVSVSSIKAWTKELAEANGMDEHDTALAYSHMMAGYVLR